MSVKFQPLPPFEPFPFGSRYKAIRGRVGKYTIEIIVDMKARKIAGVVIRDGPGIYKPIYFSREEEIRARRMPKYLKKYLRLLGLKIVD